MNPVWLWWCVGAEEEHWAQGRTFLAFLCLSDAARRSAFSGTMALGEGVEKLGLGGVEGLMSH